MNIEEQVELLMQGTEYGDEELKKAMTNELRQRLMDAEKEGRPLRVYCGYDPRTSDLHLGHTITMRKLRQFQDLGHDVTFLIGTGTSMVGDPSDQDRLRAVLTREQTEHNARTYAEQAYHVLDRQKTKVRFNHEWLLDLKLADLIKLGSGFTIQQFVARENFKLRWDKGEPVYLHETFYALMQGYDAVALNADVQVGGSDQLFNIITAGRKLQEMFGQRPQVGILLAILPGTDGVIRMSKSLGNHIPILADPEDMYGKVMSLPDHVMPIYFKLVTRYTPEQVRSVENALANQTRHPRDVKMELAREIVSIFHGEAHAVKAEEHFKRVFQEREAPREMPEHTLKKGETVLDVILASRMASSRSEARRLIDQKGVRLDGEALERGDVPFPHPGVLQVGRRKFLRVK
ncbi:MAG: tyrosine--tRNA ligase [Anaerolineales bacterium]|nr:tyrosine--tRNA ligase [Anaerolineales bacterium]